MYADHYDYRDPFGDDERLQALAEQGEKCGLALGASRHGVPVDLRPVAVELKAVNDRIEEILAADYPETYAEIQREAAEERAAEYAKNQATIAAAYERHQFRAEHFASYLTPPTSSKSAAKQAEPARPRGVPLEIAAPEFCDMLAWTYKQFSVIARSQRPTVRMVPPGTLRLAHATGMYDVESNTIYIVAGQSEEHTARTLFHEMTHAYERVKGWIPNEGVAEEMEHILLAKWHAAHRRAA